MSVRALNVFHLECQTSIQHRKAQLCEHPRRKGPLRSHVETFRCKFCLNFPGDFVVYNCPFGVVSPSPMVTTFSHHHGTVVSATQEVGRLLSETLEGATRVGSEHSFSTCCSDGPISPPLSPTFLPYLTQLSTDNSSQNPLLWY